MTSISEAQPLPADRVHSRERGPALVGALTAVGSVLMPKPGASWLLLALAAGIAAMLAAGRMLARAGAARRLTWPAQPAVAMGSLWIAGLLLMVAFRGPLPSVWDWSFVLIAIFVALLGIAALVEMVIHREGIPAAGATAAYGTATTTGVVLLAVALVVVSAVLH